MTTLGNMKKKVKIIGILNVTPDSFSDGGMYFGNLKKATERAKLMVSQGADIIDVGGESTRPGAEKVSVDDEISRVLPVIKAIKKELKNVTLSVDTYKAEVAQEALRYGAEIVNSLGGFTFDKKLAQVVSDANCKIILYHIKGTPDTMQKGEIFYQDVVGEIKDFFLKQINIGINEGMKREQFILDPGIGFGKTVEQNVEIIKRIDEFTELELPIAIGVSRKSHLGKILQKNMHLKEIPGISERLEAGLAETAIAVMKGVTFVRTHDAAETKRFLSALEEFI